MNAMVETLPSVFAESIRSPDPACNLSSLQCLSLISLVFEMLAIGDGADAMPTVARPEAAEHEELAPSTCRSASASRGGGGGGGFGDLQVDVGLVLFLGDRELTFFSSEPPLHDGDVRTWIDSVGRWPPGGIFFAVDADGRRLPGSRVRGDDHDGWDAGRARR